MNTKLSKKLKELPKNPGVYIYRDSLRHIIYVGKAVNLKNRVSSYFKSKDLDIKTEKLVENIESLEWIVCDSEIEALLLESELIKRYKPKYNIEWKDDKNYCYIKFTKEDYPRVSVVRQVVDDKADYLGPYIDAAAVRLSLKALRKIFPFCTCFLSPDKICLYYHLGLCKGHGDKYISSLDYKANIANLISFLNGKKIDVKKNFEKEMKKYSTNKEYEKAAEVRDRINALSSVRSGHVIEDKRELKTDTALEKLKVALKMDAIPDRMECYDISNIFGRAAVGSMVVFERGVPKKSDYRRFEIKTVKRIDDFAMHQEVLKRRFGRMGHSKDKSFSKVPELLIIDGGKGQLSAAMEILAPLKISVRVIGLAKRLEEVFYVDDNGKFQRVIFPENSESRFLLQRIRDEAHRFAITYHRNLRSKELVSSSLDNIYGIGPKTKKKLIKSFGTLDNIKQAKVDELRAFVSEELAKRIKEEL